MIITNTPTPFNLYLCLFTNTPPVHFNINSLDSASFHAHQWSRRLEGWSNTEALLSGWRRVTQQGVMRFCTWWTVYAAWAHHLPRSGTDQLLMYTNTVMSYVTQGRHGLVIQYTYAFSTPYQVAGQEYRSRKCYNLLGFNSDANRKRQMVMQIRISIRLCCHTSV